MNGANIKIHNEFHITVIDAHTGKIKQECTTYNLVTNRLYQYWTNMYYYHAGYYSASNPGGRPTSLFVSSSTAEITPEITTVPTPNWRLGISLSNASYDGDTCTMIKTCSTTFPETSANAALTTVGILSASSSSSNDITLTCAKFTDAEGHPITIEKTDTDRLKVDYKMYVTITYNNQSNDFKLLARVSANQFLNTANTDDLSQAPSLLHQNMGTSYTCNGYSYFGLSTVPWNAIYQDNSLIRLGTSTSSGVTDYSFDSNNRATTLRVTSTSCNINLTYQIKSIVYSGFGYIPLPNSAIFPPKEVTLTAVGDGVTTDFNFGIPILKSDMVEVSIDDVVQSSAAYTWNGRDYTFSQAWESCDHKNVCSVDRKCSWSDGISSSTYGLSPFVGNSIGGSYSHDAVNDALWYDYVYDFKTPYTVSSIESSVNIAQTSELYYSTNKENWTQVSGWTGQTTKHVDITPISARYWKVINGTRRISGSHTAADIPVMIRFGNPTPQLRFNFVPAEGAVITVKAYTEYPIKNSNWIIEPITLDFLMERGS